MSVLRRHWRAASAFAVGLPVGIAALALGQKLALSIVLGADAGAAVFLLTTGAVILNDEETDIRRRAAYDDANVAVIMGLVLGAMGASLSALIFALRQGKGAGHEASSWLVILAVLTLIESWLVVQMLFCIHYAHLYFGDVDNDQRVDRGVKFEGEQPKSYREFWYMAVCMGATFQVSDFSLTTTRFRDVITIHALIAFAFNTLVLALGVGIVGNLLG